jgi:hypothetical protein
MSGEIVLARAKRINRFISVNDYRITDIAVQQWLASHATNGIASNVRSAVTVRQPHQNNVRIAFDGCISWNGSTKPIPKLPQTLTSASESLSDLTVKRLRDASKRIITRNHKFVELLQLNQRIECREQREADHG